MKKTKKRSLYKTLRLVNVLMKCNGKETSSKDKAIIPHILVVILKIAGIVLLSAALFLAAFFFQPVVTRYVSLYNIVPSLMLIMAIVSFMIALKNIITVLYTADDLSTLIPMPISDTQIVAAKLIVASRFPVFMSMIIIYSIFLGLGIRAGQKFTYFFGTAFAGIIIPVCSIAIALALVVIVFRIFGAIRNRDIVVVLGSLFTLLIIVGYLFINYKLNGANSGRFAVSAFSVLATAGKKITYISGLFSFMFFKNVITFLLSIAMMISFLVLDFVLVRLFYFSVALSVSNTGTSGKAVSSRDISGSKQKGLLKSLFSVDFRSVKRNPSYLVYGFGMTFIWPLLIILPALSNNSTIAAFIAPPYPFDIFKLSVESIGLALTASGFASALNILAATSITRDGDNIRMIKTMPIDYKDYLKSKRNTSLLIVSLGSISYIFIIAVISLITGMSTFSSVWVFLLAIAICFALNVIWTDLALLKDAKKPVLDWDSETEFTRKMGMFNYIALIAGFVGYMGMLLFSVLYNILLQEGTAGDMTIPAIVIIMVSLAVSLLIAFLVNRRMLSKGSEYISRL